MSTLIIHNFSPNKPRQDKHFEVQDDKTLKQVQEQAQKMINKSLGEEK